MSEHMGYNPEETIHMAKPKHETGQPAPETDEITPYRAYSIFENAVINTINDELESSGKQIISSDGTVDLEWFVDEETPQGRFAIIRRTGQKIPAAENELKEYVLEKDEKTGETFQVEKMSGPIKLPKEIATIYDLDINQVRKIFNKLEPVVKKSFIDGLKESLNTNIALVKKFNDALKLEMRHEAKKELETQIIEQELAQEKIKKELQALA